MAKRPYLTPSAVAILVGMTFTQFSHANGLLTTAAGNARWNYAAATHTATFLGSDQPELLALEFNKSPLLGSTLTIESDGQAVHLLSGKSPPLILAIAAKADGATTTLKLDGGDDPHLSVNNVQSPRLQGRWIQVVRDGSDTFTLELDHATFATVHVDPGSGLTETPVTAATTLPVARKSADSSNSLLHDVKASKLLASEKAFGSAVWKNCAHCEGTGKVTTQEQDGTHKEGIFNVPDYRSVTQTCTLCGGKGKVRSSDEVLKRLCGTFLKDLAKLDQADANAQDAISQSYEMVTSRMIGDFKTWVMLNQNGRSILSRPSPEAGTAVVAQVEVLKCDEAQGGRKDFVVRLVGTDQKVHVATPMSADRLASGFALMGGLVDTGSAAGESKQMPTVAGGFLIAPPIEKSWYWWWDSKWYDHP